jgi:hypothetical protein
MPWAIDGGDVLDGTRCTPIAAMPRERGDPCEVDGPLSGIDDCAAGMMCWDVDPEMNTGVCVDMCLGGLSDAVCVDPTTACLVDEGGVVIACVPPCDPLLQDCAAGEGCYPADSGFFCRVAGGAAYGESCETDRGCAAGHVCAAPEQVFGCEGDLGCCTEFCYLAAGDPDEICSGAADGHTCRPFADGEGPPAVAIGVCTLPR